MTTTDSNGIVLLQDTDNIAPFHTLINTLQAATSAQVKRAKKGLQYAANNTARDTLLALYGSSASEPFWVDVAGTLYRHDGTAWAKVAAAGVGTVLTADTSASYTGPLGGGVAATAATVTVTPGTWLIQAGVAVSNATTLDLVRCAITDLSAQIGSSLGTGSLTSTTAGEAVGVVSKLAVYTATANKALYPAAYPNGASTAKIVGGGSGPSAWITATRIA